MRPLPALQLRRLLLRHLSTSSPPLPLQTHIPFPSNKPTHFHNSQPTITTASISHPKPFSSSISTRPVPHPNPAQLAHSLSTELLRDPDSDAPSVSRRLQSTFPRFAPTPSLVRSVLDLSADADRRAILGFYSRLISNNNLDHGDQILSFFVDYFGQRRDFKAAHDVIRMGRKFAGPKTAASNFDGMVRAGRVSQAVAFFDHMDVEYGIKRERGAVKLAVEKVCENAFAAERMVRRLANEVPKNVETWNVVVSCLCKIRKTEDALKLFHRMCGMGGREPGFGPNETTYVVLVRSLYKAGRIEEGDAMLERMKAAGLKVDNKVYYRILKTLSSVGKFDHAVSLVKKMKEDGCEPGVKVYLLMMDKLSGDYRVDKAVALTKPGQLKLRPRLHELHEPFKRKQKPVKHKETISEKVKRKRRRIKQVRLLFVKKPIRGLHRPF
ncbi:putative tetratricopeptide-like helical domain-containing protein [Rosa chinensis]|uniref:Putative tetratricopeptide-like helical domain-containing protein n=1 Tax=Rosa chinensis TaxID=74649 RepID=A0A2P6P366_ROSCH|nr:pentatricopeptide repeat-containing protein PNM1, mitochondrial [Rosa chinensis]PRQ16359.1 putative tetratricopeptide-like helical domain-containing protein [Rosa chinensis]